jgi:hypothetical protein
MPFLLGLTALSVALLLGMLSFHYWLHRAGHGSPHFSAKAEEFTVDYTLGG